jgi:uncharacterized SAM-binding protein YcdF (DUF218 family)
VLFFFLFITFIFVRNIYYFLTPVEPVPAKILVLEGSVNDHVLKHAIHEFYKGKYQWLMTTGTPLDYGSHLSEYKNTAFVTGQSLIQLGFDSSKLIMVASQAAVHDRTFNSAIQLKWYLDKNMHDCHSINLISQGVHARRSRILFEKAFGPSFSVGILAIPGSYYNGRNWWQSSKGFREVMNEVFGYFYVRFFFRPYETELLTK